MPTEVVPSFRRHHWLRPKSWIPSMQSSMAMSRCCPTPVTSLDLSAATMPIAAYNPLTVSPSAPAKPTRGGSSDVLTAE
jgi:hypothetical protein